MKSKVIWIGKKRGSPSKFIYEIGLRKNDWDKVNGFLETCLEMCCKYEIEKLGIKLKAGEVRKFRLVEVK